MNPDIQLIPNASEPRQHPEQTQQQDKSQTRQELNNKSVKSSQLYYRILLITSIQVQSVDTSNKCDISISFDFA